MTESERLEAHGQTTIFDVIDLQIGDQVCVVLYEDELPYAMKERPYLLKVGKVVEIKLEAYYVAFGAVVEAFDKGKLRRDVDG